MQSLEESLSKADLAAVLREGVQSGFQNNYFRKRAWQLLLSRPLKVKKLELSKSAKQQLNKDSVRSFNSENFRKADHELISLRKEELEKLMEKVFESRPELHYYQGFNDVCTVLLSIYPLGQAVLLAGSVADSYCREFMRLDFSESLVPLLEATEKLLFRKDSRLGSRLTNKLLIPSDWFLTMFYRLVPDLRLLLRLWDYIFCRSPIVLVTLAAAVILLHKEALLALPEHPDEEELFLFFRNIRSTITTVEPIISISEGILSEENLLSEATESIPESSEQFRLSRPKPRSRRPLLLAAALLVFLLAYFLNKS